MNLDLKNIQPRVEAMPIKCIVYGRNGIGKSRFAAKAPKPIFLDLDENLYEMPVVSNRTLKVPLKTFEEIQGFLGELFNQEHDFKTVVIDTLSALEVRVFEKICKDAGVSSIASLQYGQGYTSSMPLWKSFLDALKALWEKKNMNIVLLGHHKVREETNLTGESYPQYQLNLYEKASELFRNWCSAVLFADEKVLLKEEKLGFQRKISKVAKSTRILYTDGGTTFLAKNTYDLPLEIPLEWETFASHVKDYYQNANNQQKGE